MAIAAGNSIIWGDLKVAFVSVADNGRWGFLLNLIRIRPPILRIIIDQITELTVIQSEVEKRWHFLSLSVVGLLAAHHEAKAITLRIRSIEMLNSATHGIKLLHL